MNSTSDEARATRGSWTAWAKLVRFPAVFTVIAQVVAGHLLIAGSVQPVARMLVAVLAGIALYWAGMILNDVYDYAEDLRERPSRPLPAGLISLKSAKLAGFGCMIAGVALAMLSGFIPAAPSPQTFAPAIVGATIAICVLLYNGILKETLLAPAMMGNCRALCLLLGAAPLVLVDGGNLTKPEGWFESHVLGFAIGTGIYIMGITLISKGETTGGQRAPVAIGTVLVILGAVCIGLSPKLAPVGTVWKMDMSERFILLVGLFAFPIVFRGIRAAIRPEPLAIQHLIRAGVLTLIPLSGAIALLPAGPYFAMLVFLLVIPAIFSAAWIRVT